MKTRILETNKFSMCVNSSTNANKNMNEEEEKEKDQKEETHSMKLQLLSKFGDSLGIWGEGGTDRQIHRHTHRTTDILNF